MSDGPTDESAMVSAGRAIATHTEEVRAMHWVQIGLTATTMFMVAGASLGQLVVMWLMYQQDKARDAVWRGLYVNQHVQVEQRQGWLDDTLERIHNEKKGLQ